MLEPHAFEEAHPFGFHAAAHLRLKPEPADQRQPGHRDDDTPHRHRTDTAGDAGTAEICHRGQPQQCDYANAGGDRATTTRKKRRQVADRGDRDGHVADRQRQKIEEEHQEVAGFTVGILGIGRHPTRALVKQASLGEAVGDRHRAERRHDPRQQRDRADLRHIGGQHDDARAHHVDRDHKRQLDEAHPLYRLRLRH